MRTRWCLAALLFFLFPGCALAAPPWSEDPRHTPFKKQVTRERALAQDSVPVFTFQVVRTHPHDRSSFTEGLVMHEGFLYESSGLYGRSRLSKFDLETGEKLQQARLKSKYFAEGIVIVGREVFQLTYKSNMGFVYDLSDFSPLRTFSFPSQGWGLTYDGRRLIASDGSAALAFLDPENERSLDYVIVEDENGPVGYLNELEYVDGAVYANVWKTDLIARIDPQTGRVTGWIDLTGLFQPKNPTHVLNGIACNKISGRLLVTGKCWPHIYEIDLKKLTPGQRKKALEP